MRLPFGFGRPDDAPEMTHLAVVAAVPFKRLARSGVSKNGMGRVEPSKRRIGRYNFVIVITITKCRRRTLRLSRHGGACGKWRVLICRSPILGWLFFPIVSIGNAIRAIDSRRGRNAFIRAGKLLLSLLLFAPGGFAFAHFEIAKRSMIIADRSFKSRIGSERFLFEPIRTVIRDHRSPEYCSKQDDGDRVRFPPKEERRRRPLPS